MDGLKGSRHPWWRGQFLHPLLGAGLGALPLRWTRARAGTIATFGVTALGAGGAGGLAALGGRAGHPRTTRAAVTGPGTGPAESDTGAQSARAASRAAVGSVRATVARRFAAEPVSAAVRGGGALKGGRARPAQGHLAVAVYARGSRAALDAAAAGAAVSSRRTAAGTSRAGSVAALTGVATAGAIHRAAVSTTVGVF